MQEVYDFLAANPNGCLATVEDGRPRVRPWGFMMVKDEKLWFCTANTKKVYQQLCQTPYIEFTASSPQMQTIRITGKIAFSSDITVKEAILAANPLVRQLYKSADNPVFEAFYLEHGQAVFSEIGKDETSVYEF